MFEFKSIFREAKQYNKDNNTSLTYLEYFMLQTKHSKSYTSSYYYMIALDLKKVLKSINISDYALLKLKEKDFTSSSLWDVTTLHINNRSVGCLIKEDEPLPFFYDMHTQNKKCGHFKFHFSANQCFIFDENYNYQTLNKYVHKYLKDHNKIFITNENLAKLSELLFQPKVKNTKNDNYINLDEILSSSRKTKNLLSLFFNTDIQDDCFQSIFNVSKKDIIEFYGNQLKTADFHIPKKPDNIFIYGKFIKNILDEKFGGLVYSAQKDDKSILSTFYVGKYLHDDLKFDNLKILVNKKTAYSLVNDEVLGSEISDDVFMDIYNSLQSICEYINQQSPQTNKIINEIVLSAFENFNIQHFDNLLIEHNIEKSSDLYRKIPFSIKSIKTQIEGTFTFDAIELKCFNIDDNFTQFNRIRLPMETKKSIEHNITAIRSIAEKTLLQDIVSEDSKINIKKRL